MEDGERHFTAPVTEAYDYDPESGTFTPIDASTIPPMQIVVSAPLGRKQDDAQLRRWMERVEWHYTIQGLEPAHRDACHRHGVIRGIRRDQYSEVMYFLSYHWIIKNKEGCWWQKRADGLYDVEFVGQSDSHLGRMKPWEWCGHTILFGEWQLRERLAAKIRGSFQVGDRVQFDAKGMRYTGVVSGIRKNLTVIVGHSKWTVSPQLATKIG